MTEPSPDLAPLFARMAAQIARRAPLEELNETAVPGLCLYKASQINAPRFCAQWPTLVLMAQGAKSMMLGQETFRYGVGDFMVVSMDLPIISAIIEASPEKPLLSVGIALRPERLRAMLDLGGPLPRSESAEGLRGVGVSRISAPLLDATMRYLDLLDAPADIPALAPLIEQEIFYRLLTGPYGPRLIQNMTMDSPANRVGRAINWLRENYGQTLRIEGLAAHVGMSVSSLHHHFRAITAMTPMQYQKQLRLNEARRLMLVDEMDVGSAAFAVGYASRSQFGLEYARHFGTSPSRDIAALRAGAGLPPVMTPPIPALRG
ncbi:MAG: AraC family transcriptional regulator [Proteobacteria bacterium]|nr:AraC family transcriptional regulator [Pseudomonadota bacterium]